MAGAMFIYRNLNAAKAGLPSWQYGPKPKQPVKGSDGQPLRHAIVLAANVTFRESAASWARCLRNVADRSCKSGWDVHAYAVGDVFGEADAALCAALRVASRAGRVAITYDKYGCGRFIRKDTGAPLAYCEFVHFRADGHCDAYGRITEEG